jgi:hypothetical protein
MKAGRRVRAAIGDILTRDRDANIAAVVLQLCGSRERTALARPFARLHHRFFSLGLYPFSPPLASSIEFYFKWSGCHATLVACPAFDPDPLAATPVVSSSLAELTLPHISVMVSDDLPWPELGNVSRGATRGNQGQKGVLSPPDRLNRCTLQLRVQPGVLTVLLNRKTSEWYRTLDNEVNQALKLTKTHWRKARRRQDYDAQADQEHMELHEWLQQLKDKVMSHLELLMQRGDIKGPPFIMPDDVELTFLRKFIERQQAGIPHNPRLREAFLQGRLPLPPRPIVPSSRATSDEPVAYGSDSGWGDEEIKASVRGRPLFRVVHFAFRLNPPQMLCSHILFRL